MRTFIFIIAITIFSLLSSCTSDEMVETSVIGTWKLSTWTIDIPIDLNDDMMSHTNLLDEASCTNEETLVFDADGVVASIKSYNPIVIVTLIEGTTSEYQFYVVCDVEGAIGTSGTYSQNKNRVSLFNRTAAINGNQLTIIYEDAVDIFNELNEVVSTKDLTLVYTKK